MLKYVYDELTECFYLYEDDELHYLIAQRLEQLSEKELEKLLGQDNLVKFRSRYGIQD